MQVRSVIRQVIFFSVAFLGVHGLVSQPRPLTTYKNLETSRTLFDVPFSYDPASTVLVVIDFWDEVAPREYIDRTISLIDLMRSNYIPVIFISHEFPVTSELELTEKDVILDGYTRTLESFFAADSLDIKTILYAGYHTAECVIITRLNSISRLSWRTDEFNIVVVKDCTWSGYWHYTWAMNAIETKFLSTDLSSLYASLYTEPEEEGVLDSPGARFSARDDTDFSSPYYEDYKRKYRRLDLLRMAKDKGSGGTNKRDNFDQAEFINYDSAFGGGEDWSKYALVVLNPVSNHPDSTWLNRAKENNQRNLKPLVGFAKDKGIPINYFLNEQEMDSIFDVVENDSIFNDSASLFKHLESVGTTTILFAGNLTSFFRELTPLDAWRFTIFNGGFKVVFLEDCIISDEIEESEEYEVFKFVFLERAIFYREMYTVSTLALLSQNIRDISLNESYLDSYSDTLYVEIFNKSSLPAQIADFKLRFSEAGPTFDLPPYVLEPKTFFTFQSPILAPDGPLKEFESERIYLVSSTSDELVIDSIPYVRDRAIGKFPNGGAALTEYHSPSLGSSNYFLTQDRTLCDNGETVTISVNGAEGFDYTWYLNETLLGEKTPSINSSEPGEYRVIVLFSDTSIESRLNIEKIPLPDAEVYVDYNTVGNVGVLSLPELRTDEQERFKYFWKKDDIIVGTDYKYQAEKSGIYSVVVESDDGCAKESRHIELMVDEHYVGGDLPRLISVSPNPSAGQFTIYLKSDSDIRNISFYNNLGRRILVKEIDGVENLRSLLYNSSMGVSLDVNLDLGSGIYFIAVEWEDGLRDVARIVVSK